MCNKMAPKSDFPDALALLFKVLHICVCWEPEQVSKTVLRIYGVYTIAIQSFTLLIFFTVQIIYVTQAIDDLDKFADAIFLPLTYFAQSVKVGNFLLMRGRVRKLNDEITKSMYQPRNDRQCQMLGKRMINFKRTYIFFMLLGAATITLWGASSLFDKNAERRLPISAWYPFDFKQSPVFEIMFIVQIFSLSVNSATNVTLDCLIPAFTSYICAQLEFLNDSLEHIKKETANRLEKKRQECMTIINDELFNEMGAEQIRCVTHHCSILELCTEINNMFSIATLIQLLTSIFTICIRLFRLSLVSPSTVEFWSMVAYQGCMLMELFLFSYYGNEALLQSAELLTSLYNSDWTDCPYWFKRNNIIIMICAHRPLNMMAGNFFIFSLQTFMMILRTSYSYYAVLHRMHSK